MRSKAWNQLALTNARELLRDGKTLSQSTVFPFFFLGMFYGLGLLTHSEAFVRVSFVMAVFMAMASVAFFGTAMPLVALRERGTLRLLSTTPVSRVAFLSSQAPARLVLAMGQLTVIIFIAVITGHLSPANIPALLLAAFLGLTMLFALGFLLANFVPTAEAAGQTLAIVMILLVFGSGVGLPLDMFPNAFRTAAALLPTTYPGDLLIQLFNGTGARHSPLLDYGVLILSTLALGSLAARLFRWDLQKG